MDTPTSAVLDEKTPPPELALATQLGKEKSSPSGPPEIGAAVARLTSNSIDELHKLVSKNARILEVRGRRRAAANRQRGGRN